ncbi:MAG TPA: hypothetical protein DD381_02985 [Lentisphaeria bacterium]|nr:MAG: hypothetical protein A2X47_03265 [Lentisphaerae bacterium GWF2_38_69]HBM15298.1 hypothetical protein [Lentisphaeria bacterium]
MEKWKKIIKNFLLAFVLISIGFALGKNFAQNERNETVGAFSHENKKSVSVFYFHSSFRCVSCNSIELKTKAFLDSYYKDYMDEGIIKFTSEDFQKNETLAGELDVYGSGVIIALYQGNKILESRKLDEVWTLLDKPVDFDSYLKTNINEFFKLREENT